MTQTYWGACWGFRRDWSPLKFDATKQKTKLICMSLGFKNNYCPWLSFLIHSSFTYSGANRYRYAISTPTGIHKTTDTICSKPQSFPLYSWPMFSDVSSCSLLSVKITHSNGTDKPTTAKRGTIAASGLSLNHMLTRSRQEGFISSSWPSFTLSP